MNDFLIDNNKEPLTVKGIIKIIENFMIDRDARCIKIVNDELVCYIDRAKIMGIIITRNDIHFESVYDKFNGISTGIDFFKIKSISYENEILSVVY